MTTVIRVSAERMELSEYAPEFYVVKVINLDLIDEHELSVE